MNTIDFEDFADRQYAQHGRLPLSGTLEITRHCNLRCRHCYMCDYRPGEAELSLNEIHNMLDQLADAGCLRLLITGGEPLLRPDFPEIWKHAKSRGIMLTLFTNATLVDDKIEVLLKEWPPLLVEVSIYGASPETYEKICGDGGAFEKMIEGLERLKRVCPHINAKTIAMPDNANDIDGMQSICDKYEIQYCFDTDIFPRLNGDAEPLKHAFGAEEGTRLLLESELHQRIYLENKVNAAKEHVPAQLKRANFLLACRAGERSFHIDPYGHLVLCSLLREPSYSLREGRFMEGWNTVISDLRKAERKTRLECADCPDLDYCVPCAGRNLLETGSAFETAPVMCERSHARAQAFREKEKRLGEKTQHV
jgi:radical SAM protein with 4Fe4S-binding SPASM domain